MIDEGMSTLKTNTAERQAAIRNLLSNVDHSTKDADTAFWIELIGGALGLFGIGHLYAGLTNTGIFRLIVGLVALTAAYMLLGFTFVGFCLYPLVWIGQVALAYFSANDLKTAINAVKTGGYSAASASATPSNFGGYIENPTPMPSDVTLNPRTPEVVIPPTTPATPPAPYTPSTPDVTYSPSIEETISSAFDEPTTPPPAAEPYMPSNEEGTDVEDNNDFDPDDLTKKV